MRIDLQAEQAVLGAAIQSPTAFPALLSLLEIDFTSTRHRLIAAVVRDMIRQRYQIDVLTVQSELRARGKLESAGTSGYLHDLVNLAPVPSSATYYARMVREATRVRMAAAAAADLVQQLELEEAAAEYESLLIQHRARLEQTPGAFDEASTDELDTVTALLAETFGPQQWVIPGLFTRGERIVITGSEGLAKSTISRQMAVCVAGGLNPWNGQRVTDGQRVLYIDAENSRFQSHNAYGWIGRRCQRPMIAPGWSDRIIHKTRNDGCDLPGRDAGWFHQMAAQHSPDLIILGPAYKLMRGDPQKDSDVLALLQVIDEVRVKHDAAVLIETHSPHGMDGHRPVRPYGSSVWLRWPEVGFGIRPTADSPVTPEQRPKELELVAWRGQRETRDWPDLIRHGGGFELPWMHVRQDWRPSVNTHYEIPESESGAA
jgi:hypothetical protein